MAVVQKIPCRVEAIIPRGEQVYTVILRPQRRLPQFRAGQFLHLALDDYDPSGFWPDSRVFSIASSPAEKDRLEIAYSVRGRFTARMAAELAEGNTVWIKLPYGDFVIDGSRPAVLLAGGTGITAFTAFLESLGPANEQPVTLAYGARSRELLLYRSAAERCAAQVSHFQVIYFLEDLAGGQAGERELPGRVVVGALWPYLSHPLAAHYYIAGPPAMITTVTRDLRDCGVSAETIHVDAWN